MACASNYPTGRVIVQPSRMSSGVIRIWPLTSMVRSTKRSTRHTGRCTPTIVTLCSRCGLIYLGLAGLLAVMRYGALALVEVQHARRLLKFATAQRSHYSVMPTCRNIHATSNARSRSAS